MKPVFRFTHIAAVVAALSVLAGCSDKTAGAPGGGMPPTEVAVVTIAPERLAVTNELPGRLEANRVAQVRARVPGIVLKRSFTEGSQVKAGDVLFRIDPASFQATHDSAQAALAKAEANLAQASLKLQRYKPLVELNAISKQEYDDASAAQKQAAADVAAAKAARQSASLNLTYATVTAPISGQIGRALVTEGALVGQGEVTPLATIQQLDPIYVNLTQSSAEWLKLRQAMDSGQLKSVGKDQAKVTLVTEDGKAYRQSGKLLFSDITVDESTGAITLRASFPNPEHLLLPGMFVRAQLEQAVNESAISVPQQAVARSVDGASVMLVGADGKVAVRTVKTGNAQGNAWLISEGLQAGDRVIVEGLQKIKPGAVVKVVPWQPKAADTGTTTPASSQPDGAKKPDAAAPAASAAKAQ